MCDSIISFMLHNFIHTTDGRGVKTIVFSCCVFQCTLPTCTAPYQVTWRRPLTRRKWTRITIWWHLKFYLPYRPNIAWWIIVPINTTHQVQFTTSPIGRSCIIRVASDDVTGEVTSQLIFHLDASLPVFPNKWRLLLCSTCIQNDIQRSKIFWKF